MEREKWAVVTGSTGGIGRAIATALAKDGMNLVLHVRREDERSARLLEEVKATGAEVFVAAADISKWDECERMIKEITEKTGRVDLLVNNAGITKDNLVLRMSAEDFDQVIDTNLSSCFYLSKAVFPLMMKARRGKIVNITSYVGIHGNVAQANYSAAKAGMIGLTKACAKEFASRNVTVNAIAPGFIQSPMTDVLSDKVKEDILGQIPLGHFGQPEDIAHMVAFLASPAADYITGQIFSVDGGMSI